MFPAKAQSADALRKALFKGSPLRLCGNFFPKSILDNQTLNLYYAVTLIVSRTRYIEIKEEEKSYEY
ncbi:MAG TPA: hypothetical protein VFS77_09055, partial [Pyrinomonadaceae bacterium]|nr:hypothetical protein [Pyrinomonadaceae bacterium]